MASENRSNSIPIIGAWKLISFEITVDDGRVLYPFGEDAYGSIIYTESGRFAAQVMRRNRLQIVSGDQMKGTPEEIKANYEGVVSYFGPYEFNAEEGYVIHQVEGSLFPNWEGDGQKRFCEFIGDNRIKLSTPPTLWGGGGEIVASLIWERIDS
ncbi:MAG: lipocalin-like domain-containing protein [Chloroflexi bacterium]|nr:MAG: lipocalin-like domain-containing protein [Chloroflexota bacterium]